MRRILTTLAYALLIFVSPMAQADDNLKSINESSKTDMKATFAGGCFWCMEHPFDALKGVKKTTVGYCGGREVDPTYSEVSAGATEHAEAIEVLYDPDEISYQELLDVFWRNIDPTTKNQQFADIGAQYRTAIFYHDEKQKQLALDSLKEMENSRRFGKPIVTEISPATQFYRAEEYHQEYYRKNPLRYKMYRFGSGRDQYLKKIWGKEAKSPSQ